MSDDSLNRTAKSAKASAVSLGERALIKLFDVEDAVQAAIGEAGNTRLPGALGGPQDAYRHILVTAEIVRQKGEARGVQFGKGHEFGSVVKGTQTDQDEEMDDHNNALAIEIGKKAKTWQDVVRMAREKITEAARHGGDGKEGRAVWYNKPQQAATTRLHARLVRQARGAQRQGWCGTQGQKLGPIG